MVLRRWEPELVRPYCVPLYPLQGVSIFSAVCYRTRGLPSFPTHALVVQGNTSQSPLPFIGRTVCIRQALGSQLAIRLELTEGVSCTLEELTERLPYSTNQVFHIVNHLMREGTLPLQRSNLLVSYPLVCTFVERHTLNSVALCNRGISGLRHFIQSDRPSNSSITSIKSMRY
jgi:hypothetical protein